MFIGEIRNLVLAVIFQIQMQRSQFHFQFRFKYANYMFQQVAKCFEECLENRDRPRKRRLQTADLQNADLENRPRKVNKDNDLRTVKTLSVY